MEKAIRTAAVRIRIQSTVIDWNSIPLHIKEIEEKDKFKAAVAQYFSQ